MRLRVAAIVAMLATAAACAPADTGRLTAPSLTLTPCTGDTPRTFTPFVLEGLLFRWAQAGNTGQIEIRDTWEAATLNNSVVVQMNDLASVRKQFADDPTLPLAIDGTLIRVSLDMVQTCPDATQDVEAESGTLQFTSLETGTDGRIVGTAKFDLIDRRARAAGKPATVAKDATLTFDFSVRRGRPWEDFMQ